LSTDVTKHAVLGKFNEIRPGVYREYMRDVCEKVRGIPRVQEKTIKNLAFQPLAPAALFLRIAITFLVIKVLYPSHL